MKPEETSSLNEAHDQGNQQQPRQQRSRGTRNALLSDIL